MESKEEAKETTQVEVEEIKEEPMSKNQMKRIKREEEWEKKKLLMKVSEKTKEKRKESH